MCSIGIRPCGASPTAFRPERFLPEARAAIDRFAYLPFGAGPRVCIGASFALQEAMIVLATIVRSVRLDLADGHVVNPVHRITLRPRNGLPMSLSHRRNRPIAGIVEGGSDAKRATAKADS